MISLSPETLQAFSRHAFEVEEASYAVRVPLDPRLFEDVSFIFLCFTNRCGSNYIAEALASNGKLNVANEWWNGQEIVRVCRHFQFDTIDRYIEGTSRFNMRNGRLMSKVGIENLVLLFRSGFFDSPGLRCHFIHVERSDTLDQAISHVLALETSAWAYYNPETKPRSAAEYSRDKILDCMQAIAEKNRRFHEFFAMNDVAPLRVGYESFVARPDFYTKWIGKHLGIADLRYVPSKITLRRQADATNATWRSRFLDGR